MAVLNDSDFVNKEFVLKTDSPAYFSTLGKRFYFTGKKGLDLGRIRAIVVDKKSGKKFFNVVSPNYPGKQLYFKYEAADFVDLVGQGVRTTKEKADQERKAEQDKNATLLDKLKKPALIGVGIWAAVQLGKTYISTNAKH